MINITLDDIRNTAEKNKEVHRTPVFASTTLSDQTGIEVCFKAENLQKAGAFKIRGALNAVRSLSDEEKARGVITYSSGNHAQATALAAALEGINCIVVMPEDVREVKKQGARSYGAAIELAGYTTEDRRKRAMELKEQHGYTVIPPYDDPRIITGQGTVALEVLEQVSDLDYILAPIGGGGLISGIALATKLINPKIKVIGVETEGADDAKRSFEQGEIIRLDTVETIADGIRSLCVGDLNFEVIRQYVDDIVTIPDERILQMMRFFFERMKLVVEPTGAVASGALLEHSQRFQGAKVCSIISGGNIGVEQFAEMLVKEKA